MAVRARRKPLYRLEEVSQRWNLSIWDIAAYAVAREIAISFVATGLLAEEGIIDHTPDGAPQHIRQGERLLSGPVVCMVTTSGRSCSAVRRVQRFVARPGSISNCARRAVKRSCRGLRAELVVRHAELERFEAAQSLPQRRRPVVYGGRPGSGRVAPPTHDWEAVGT